jgi:Na+/H+-dicarboxylate symporter
MIRSRPTRFILVALALGVGAGGAIHHLAKPEVATSLSLGFDVVTDVFLRLVKMVIAPLVLATLTTGIAHMRQGADLGRLFARTLGWFVAASLISLALGLVMVNLLAPGHGVVMPTSASASPVVAAAFDFKQFVQHIFPVSIIRAMADNEVLQIVVFSIFAGLGLIAIGEDGRPITRVLDALVSLMIKITGYVMLAAPLAVFAAIASVIATHGLGIIVTFARFVGGFYLALGLLWIILLCAGACVLGWPPIRRLMGEIREPFLITFATASSEASYPKMLEAMERFGIRPQIASLVLPLGYSFNLDGSMMYCAFASLFIAQVYGVGLSIGQQIAMLLLLMVTSKGIAGVPRASLVVVAATIPYFHIPAEGLVLVIAIDHFLDMGRSATNVVGNAVAIAVIDRWETAREPVAA